MAANLSRRLVALEAAQQAAPSGGPAQWSDAELAAFCARYSRELSQLSDAELEDLIHAQ